jgi:hypothetical protein
MLSDVDHHVLLTHPGIPPLFTQSLNTILLILNSSNTPLALPVTTHLFLIDEGLLAAGSECNCSCAFVRAEEGCLSSRARESNDRRVGR